MEAAGRSGVHLHRRLFAVSSAGWRGDVDADAGIPVSGGRGARHHAVVEVALAEWGVLDPRGRDHHADFGRLDLRALAVELGVGDWDAGWDQHDHQRRDEDHAVARGAEGGGQFGVGRFAIKTEAAAEAAAFAFVEVDVPTPTGISNGAFSFWPLSFSQPSLQASLLFSRLSSWLVFSWRLSSPVSSFWPLFS